MTSLQIGQVVIDIQSLEQIEITKELEPGLWEARAVVTGRILQVTPAQVALPPRRRSPLLTPTEEAKPLWSWYEDDHNRRWISAAGNSTFQVRSPGSGGPAEPALHKLIDQLNEAVDLPSVGLAEGALLELDACAHLPPEAAHKRADRVLCSVLLALGQTELVRRFNQLNKYYSMKWAGLPFGEKKS